MVLDRSSNVPARRRRHRFLNPLAISPDGRTVSLAGPRVVAISDINGTHRRQVHVGPVRATAVAFQPDGRTLGAVVEDGRILVIDPTTARVRTTLVSNLAASLAFNRTGTTLATGGGDGTVTLWNLADRQPLGPPLTSSQHGTVIETLTFSANGDTVFAGSSNGSLVRYQLASSRWIDQLCAVIGRNLTPNERDAYLADSNAGRRTCPNWPAEP